MRAARSTDPIDHLDPRWLAVVSRDGAADGAFYYSVRTTGVFCHPSCASRPARPENVRFHDTVADALAAGFRPCARCRPDLPSLPDRRAAMAASACRAIETADEAPSLAALAKQAGLTPSHFHSLFKAATGVTPKAYATAHRAARVRDELLQPGTVTEAIYGAGFNSGSRFYEKADALLGMTPTAFRAAGAETSIRFAVGTCSLGAILVASSDRGVCAILLGDDPDALLRDLQTRFSRANLIGGDPGYEKTVAAVIAFIDAPKIGLTLPLDARGTAFQQRVWTALRDIPPGGTTTYTQIAARIGSPKAVRAVAGACAANPLAIVIPCHRVIRQDGGLSGYRWGIARKRQLLEREDAA